MYTDDADKDEDEERDDKEDVVEGEIESTESGWVRDVMEDVAEGDNLIREGGIQGDSFRKREDFKCCSWVDDDISVFIIDVFDFTGDDKFS